MIITLRIICTFTFNVLPPLCVLWIIDHRLWIASIIITNMIIVNFLVDFYRRLWVGGGGSWNVVKSISRMSARSIIGGEIPVEMGLGHHHHHWGWLQINFSGVNWAKVSLARREESSILARRKKSRGPKFLQLEVGTRTPPHFSAALGFLLHTHTKYSYFSLLCSPSSSPSPWWSWLFYLRIQLGQCQHQRVSKPEGLHPPMQREEDNDKKWC